MTKDCFSRVLTVFPAKRLPYSDHIVCLGCGSIEAQGTFANLNDAGGYVSSFNLPPADWTYAPENDDQVLQVVFDKEQEGTATTEPKDLDSGASLTSSETACAGDGEDGTSRRTGDVQIYLYYVKSVGWWASLIFVFAIVGFVFCISFPSTFSRGSHFPSIGDFLECLSLTILEQPFGCSGGLPTTSPTPTADWDTGSEFMPCLAASASCACS